jgi:serine/threonine protein kinase
VNNEPSIVRFGNLLVNIQLPPYCPYIKCFSAIQEGFDRSVELRMIGKEFSERSLEFQRFRNERRAFSVLDQENIVKVLDGGILNDTNYYIISGINSSSFETLLQKQNRTFSTKEILEIMQGLAKALSHIHDSGYLHLDFGIHSAYLVQDTTKAIVNSFIQGVRSLSISTLPDHISDGAIVRKTPEVINGKTIDCKTDIFLLCALAYYLGTGVSPFSDTYFDTDATGRQKLRPVPPSSISGSISRQLDELIMKGLSKDPDDRYHFAEELVATTDKALRKLEIKEQVSESAELTASSIRIDPELIKLIREQKKIKQDEIKRKNTEQDASIKVTDTEIVSTVRETIGANPVMMVIPVLVLFFVGAVSWIMSPSSEGNSTVSNGRSTSSQNSSKTPSETQATSQSTSQSTRPVTAGNNDSLMSTTIRDIGINSTNKTTFKERWKTLQAWYKDQPKQERSESVCSYSKIVQLKLNFYKQPDESCKELDTLYQKAEEYLNKKK